MEEKGPRQDMRSGLDGAEGGTGLFEPVGRPVPLSEEVATSINAAILEGRLQPGSRLPPEQDLARSFGVARTVVREAISQLKHDGLVFSRQGVGAFVAPPEARTAFRISPDCFAKRNELRKLLQLLTTVMAGAAGLAAEARSDDQLAEMQRSLDDMRIALKDEDRGATRRVDAEYRLYRLIAEASGNEHYLTITTMINGQVLGKLRSVAIKNARAAEWSEKVLSEHEAAVAAIVAQDPSAAAHAVRTHFEMATARLARRADFADI